MLTYQRRERMVLTLFGDSANLMRLQAGDGYFGLNEDRPNSVTVITQTSWQPWVPIKSSSWELFPNTLTDIKINTGVRMFSLVVESTSSTCPCS